MLKRKIAKSSLIFFGAVGIASCTSSHVHTYASEWTCNSEFHSRSATCGCLDLTADEGPHTFGEWEITTEADYGVDGSKTKKCTVCKYTLTESIPALVPQEHVHTYATELTKTPNSHYYAATCEHFYETKDSTPHSFGEFSVVREATTSATGLKTRTCSICSYVEETVIPRLPNSNVEHGEYTVADYYGGYYSPIESWTNGEDLKAQLHTLISTGFTGLVYDGNWETNQMSEQSLTNFEKVNVVYSQKDDYKANTYGGAAGSAGWQREHAFCASLMTAYNTGEAVGISNSGTSRATDFHNLFASYGAANGARGNKNLGYYSPSRETIDSKAVDADTHSDNKNYEPNDCDKGKMARAIFYMGVMYNEEETSNLTLKYNYKDEGGGSHTRSVKVAAKYKPLQIVEDYIDYSQITFTNFCSSNDEGAVAARTKYLTKYTNNADAYVTTSNPSDMILNNYASAYSDYRYGEGQFAIGNLSTLLDWNSTTVDRAEMWHNEVVYSYVHQNEGSNKGKKQGNRNPFVDYPELVDYVYGYKKDQPGNLKDLKPSAVDLELNSKDLSHYALTSHKSKYLVGNSLTKDDYTFVRVNKDFSTQASDFENTNGAYTFVASDVGEKTITLVTPTGNVSYVITVESAGGVNACNYNFMISKDRFSATKIQTTPAALLSFGGVSYKVSTGINDCPVAKKDTYVQIGNGTSAPSQTVTIESSSDFVSDGKNQISAVYIGLNTASGTTYNYKISIGGEEIKSGSFSYDKNGPQIYGVDLSSPKSGVLKIELTNCTKAVYISQISVKVN
ncbi:MAG: endonuclease [Bacilli bacterium]|nr:endonuclease [Bacilli bacterium]